MPDHEYLAVILHSFRVQCGLDSTPPADLLQCFWKWHATKISLLYYFNTSQVFVSCIMLVHTIILVKKPHGAPACAVVRQWMVFLKASHIFLSSWGVWFAPCLLPFHIPSLWQVACRRSSPPDDKPFVLKWDALWYHLVIFLYSHLWKKLQQCEINRHMEGITGRSIHIWPFSGVRCPFFSRGFEVNLCHGDMTMIQGLELLI